MMNKVFMLLFLMILSAFFIACPKKPAVKIPPPPERIEQPTIEPVVKEVEIRSEDFHTIPELRPVYFAFDKYDLTPESMEILKNNAEYIKKNPDAEILIEGHCCACGTNDYNLALGQKRATAIRNYYIQLGISERRIGTISYGEEMPSIPGICLSGHTLPDGDKNLVGITKIRIKSSTD